MAVIFISEFMQINGNCGATRRNVRRRTFCPFDRATSAERKKKGGIDGAERSWPPRRNFRAGAILIVIPRVFIPRLGVDDDVALIGANAKTIGIDGGSARSATSTLRPR